MQHELETTRSNSTRDGTRPRLRAITSASAFLGVLVMAAAAIAGPAPRVAKGEMAVATQTAATRPEVRIKDFGFQPRTIAVPVGATVTWTNADEDVHTVTSAGGAFSSAGLDSGETFSQTFSAPGTYSYFCALHPHMTARVIVK